mmetsp:Transcript_18036/g.39337  ORF Transcript_18036/g.39337 Transcript_18036/m.39337 type:complete len:202 (-) Transcript_18036:303-908(-)
MIGALRPIILESISTPSSARTWLVTCSASSSMSSLSKASMRASSINSCLTSNFSFSLWNSCKIFVVSFTFMASFVTFIALLTFPIAAAAATCVAIDDAFIATAPIWAFAVIIFSRCFLVCTSCFARAARAGSFPLFVIFARCFSSFVSCFSCRSSSRNSRSIPRWDDRTSLFVSRCASFANSFGVFFSANGLYFLKEFIVI